MILARADDATGSHRDSERKDIRPVITSTVHDCRFYDSFIREKLCVNAGVPGAERLQLCVTIFDQVQTIETRRRDLDAR